jgi:precorrin-8X/cobalt-precorrin-8 methylmutase
MEYLRDPSAIYARSFAIIGEEADLSAVPEDARTVAMRIVHACGMPEIARELRISEDFGAAARSALRNGRPVITDAEMVRHGIIAKSAQIVCLLNDTRARETGLHLGITRSAAAVSLWAPHLEGALVVIGNAPTALFALLELIDAGGPRPAALAAFPVGFVGAAESKEELVRNPRGIPYATLPGRKGGSAMAAAVVNALAEQLK